MRSHHDKVRSKKKGHGHPDLRLVKSLNAGKEMERGKRFSIGSRFLTGSFRKEKDLPAGRMAEEAQTEQLQKKKQRSSVLAALLLACVLLTAAGGYYIVTEYKVEHIYVDGMVHYTREEIIDMVMKGSLGENSMYLAFKYKEKGVENIPFIEKMDVAILSPDTIRITVYEKALAGYVEYLDKYMYFDKDGIVTECSDMRTAGIPQVTGLDFSYVVLHEPLPVEHQEVFKQILNVTQLLVKYDLSADKIFFDSDYHLTLYFGDIKVMLGESDSIDRKIMKLEYILPNLAGKKGTLSMENYNEDSKNIPFREEAVSGSTEEPNGSMEEAEGGSTEEPNGSMEEAEGGSTEEAANGIAEE